MATDKKITELPNATLPIAAGVKFEAVQGGINVQVDADDMPGSGGGGTWGSITGTLSDQTDLQTALNAKLFLNDFVTLTDAAPIVFDCNTRPEPKGYVETAVSRTFDLQNVRGNNVLNAYSVITKIIKKTTASDIVITLDAGFTNKDIITDANVTDYTLAGLNNSYHKLTGLVLGQASGAIIWWNHVVQNAGLTLTEDSIFVGATGNIAGEKTVGAEFDISTSAFILAALGITGGKIADSTITLVKLLGAVGAGIRFLSHDNAGAVTGTYGTDNQTITDGTVITALTTETGWTGNTKSIANTLEGQFYHGTGSTGVKYRYRISADGTATRVVEAEGVDITAIQLPPCTEVTGTTQQMAVNNAYVANNASQVVLTLPTTAAVGDIVEVTGKGAGGWRIAQNASEQIHGATSSTSGTGGFVESNSARYAAIKLKCITANNEWVIQNVQGAITIS